MKLAYKPFGLLAAVLAGLLARVVFTSLWHAVGSGDKPKPRQRARGAGEVVLAAALEGAVYGAVKAAADRTAARSFEKATGAWPGDTEPVKA